jgi:hypothetical protein
MIDNASFLHELSQLVARRASAEGLVDMMAFVHEVAQRLEDDPVFGEFTPVEYQGTGSRNRSLRLHGYTALDESDGTLGLVIGRWDDGAEPSTLGTAAVQQMSSQVEAFVAESINGKLNERLPEASAAYELATLMREEQGRISRIRIHVMTNLVLSQRFKEEICEPVAGTAVERHIWDLQRLKAVYASSREREAVRIELEDFGSGGIACIEASRAEGLRSLLCVVDGSLLADLFERFGSRLLEGNVRSFLGMKGGVNKGIRATIQANPELFFAYNNGIAATASEVTMQKHDGTFLITGITDLQIVNGGQTTASILNARKQSKLKLDGVTVPMKLTIVQPDKAHDLVPRIAEYANTQNKVAVADFFANHPFHQKMEEISRRLHVPAKSGMRVQSKWFYERSRGQYQNERLYLAKARKDAFDLEFPSAQVINKTELAKYDSTWNEKPHWASLGAQKNFSKFAEKFEGRGQQTPSEHWSSISENYGDDYYQGMVAVAVLWATAEKMVAAGKGDWYLGDYRPQIVSGALAKLFSECRALGREFDLQKIWQQQAVDSGIQRAIQVAAEAAQAVLLDPPQGMRNVGEWSKKEACWNRLKSVTVKFGSSLAEWTVTREEKVERERESRSRGRIDNSISRQQEVYRLAASGYWADLLAWPGLTECADPANRDVLRRASSVKGVTQLATDRQWKLLLDLRDRCEKAGWSP